MTARSRVLSSIAILGLTAGFLSLSPLDLAAAASCPVVASGTGAVSPAPSAGVDWSGCDLTGAELAGADLAGADLTSSTLVSADLTDADLTGANLNSATITDAIFTGATMTGIQSGGIPGGPAGVVTLPANWMLADGFLLGPGANATGIDMSNETFGFSGIDLVGTNLTDANLSNSWLWSTDFDDANLTGANLTGMETSQGASMSGVTLTNANLTDVQLQGVNMTGDLVTGAVLTGADLSDANLTGADFSGDTVPGGFSGANLTDANLSNTTIGSGVKNVNLSSADFTGASFSAGLESGGIAGQPTALPANWELLDGYLIGPAANLDAANLSDADLSGADLTGANLTSSTLTGANVAGATLASATLTLVTSGSLSGTPASLPADWLLRYGYLLGPQANVSQADFSGADLTDADLTGASLENDNLHAATLTGVNLTGAVLTGVESGGLTTTPASLPTNWVEEAGYLIGPGADLDGTNLTGVSLHDSDLGGASFVNADLAGDDMTSAYTGEADFAGADMTGVNLTGDTLVGTNLTGTKLAGANLSGIQSGQIQGQPASLPDNWELADGFLIGPGDDLVRAELTGVNLTSADLADANLTQADLTGAILTGADLSGADLSETTLTGVTWSNTICPDGTNSNADGNSCISNLTPVPYATPTLSGDLGNAGWYTSPVTVAWNWADANGAIDTASCTSSTESTGQGSAVTMTATCADTTGGVGTATVTAKIDTTPPSVSVTGVRAKHQYVIGTVPAPGCATTDSVSGVATPATVKVTTTGSGGVGSFTATCSGAKDVAGNRAGSVSVRYTVVYGFAGFTTPKPKATLGKSARSITVEFRLANAAGAAIAPGVAAALAKAGKVKATLTGPGIRTVTATCTWVSAKKLFRCSIKTPAGLRTGKSHRYLVTATENLGGGAVTAPATGHAVNPEYVYFR